MTTIYRFHCINRSPLYNIIFIASSDTPQPEPPQTPPPPSLSQPQVEEMEVEERSNSSSPSSLFSLPQDDDSHLLSQLQGVLREGTATPSDLQPGQNAGTHERGGGDVEGDNDETKENQRDRGEGKTPDNQADMNSEPEIANDSSLEEDSSEDGQTLMENLSLKLEESVVENPPEVMRPGEDLNHRLASLQKIVLSRLVQHVNVTEEVGGIRSMCYLQVRHPQHFNFVGGGGLEVYFFVCLYRTEFNPLWIIVDCVSPLKYLICE